jgi:hypothetical protein
LEPKPKKHLSSKGPTQLYVDPYTRMHENSFGFFLQFKIGKWNFDNDKLRWLPIVHKKDASDEKKTFIRRMLDSAGLIPREITKLQLDETDEIEIRRDHAASFTVHLDGFLDYSDAKIGDTVELHFRVIDGVFEKVCLQIVDPNERKADVEFANIILQTVQNQKDPIWYMGTQLIEQALRVTNPEDTKFYGSQSGSLSFWSYRSYDAREEIYIQWRWNSVGELYVEAVSNKFAWPKISNDGINHLIATGWSGPSQDKEDDLPNYFRTYEEVDVAKVARELMAVFRDVYLVKRDWIWLFNPFHLVEELFKGQDDDSFKFKDDAFFVGGQKHTFRRRCEMGVQLSEDILPPKWLRPWM